MSDHTPLSSEKKFNRVERIIIDGSTCEVSESYNREMIYVGDLTLDTHEAHKLIAWLNKTVSSNYCTYCNKIVDQLCQYPDKKFCENS